MDRSLPSIDLTPEEAKLADAIKFDPRATLGDTAAFHANGDLVVRLTKALLERGAVPEHRLRYFTDPDYNAGGRGKSRQDSFVLHGHDTDSLMRHGHFLKFLRYFIYGADLPSALQQTFSEKVERCGSVTSGDIAPLSAQARELVRRYRLDPKDAGDEFYKLSLDLGLSPSNAASIRSSVQQVRGSR